MRLVFLVRKSAADLEHVHVVIGSRRRVGREVKVLLYDRFYSPPCRVDVGANAPGASDLAHPCAGIVPAAHVDPHARLHRVDRLSDLRVLIALVQRELSLVLPLVAAAEVDLDEVEAKLFEEVLRVLPLVFVEPDTLAKRILVPEASASVRTGIGVNTGLEPEPMDMIDNFPKAVREALGVRLQLAVLVAPAEIAVVNVYIFVTALVETKFDKEICLLHDKLVRDVDAVGVPARPAHRRRLGLLRFARLGVQHLVGSRPHGLEVVRLLPKRLLGVETRVEHVQLYAAHSLGAELPILLRGLEPILKHQKPNGRRAIGIDEERITRKETGVVGTFKWLRRPGVVGPAQETVEPCNCGIKTKPVALVRRGKHKCVRGKRAVADIVSRLEPLGATLRHVSEEILGDMLHALRIDVGIDSLKS